jgi:hypothetical protein
MEQALSEVEDRLSSLIDLWCDRRNLEALARLLPAWTSNTGLTDGWAHVLEALRTIALRDLPGDEQQTIEWAITEIDEVVYGS